ncbi:bifunctional metallophosphatase/5'-nucleotidase [Limobrevibacterium gyesilva]|uniref:5'-nucleotidase C-terminal domain-containing protein n=1 Tax=Limobrevibacterium gyesilva TaxID=2991712 RepID=A0AA41YM69_9PROT|nr:5'-nucleotidase C-terminal domain-containing protein [Limobrevibacterium gyesilva]MCW3474523.1 5'-nucleotidase C-terminal domain-containing protein [Limobrevibacterium gyesilva]
MTLSRRLFLGALGALPMVRLARGATAHRLTILHMNDFHSRHEPVDAAALTCAPDGERMGCFGGAARLASAIAAERAAAEAAGRTVLLLDAGDQFQGSLFYTAWHGEAELAVMHALGTEAMAVGNHEFDNGPAVLSRFIRAARFPVLSANVDAAADPDLAGLIRPHVVLEKAGLRIGVVGLTTPETAVGSSPGPHVRFAEPGPTLAASAAALRAEGARLVVALSHLGVGADLGLAGAVPGVDVFVGGHSHTLLSDSEAGAAGPAHQAVDGSAGQAVVVQAACYGRYLGRLDLDLAADFTPVAYGGDCRHVGLDLPEEPRVAAIVAGYAAQLGAVRSRVVGHAPEAIGNTGCRIGECALGDLVAEAMLASVHGAEVAITNAGGLRTGLPAGDITLGDVLTALPFGNTVATLKLTGADLRDAVANGLAGAGRGAFPQIAGARLTWNPLTKSLVSLAIRQADGGFAPLDPARVYTVVTNDFMRGGGDGYAVLRQRAIDPYDAGPGLDVTVADAITAASPLRPRTDGRIAVRP